MKVSLVACLRFGRMLLEININTKLSKSLDIETVYLRRKVGRIFQLFENSVANCLGSVGTATTQRTHASRDWSWTHDMTFALAVLPAVTRSSYLNIFAIINFTVIQFVVDYVKKQRAETTCT